MPDSSLIEKFKSESGNDDLPYYCQATVCYAQDEKKALNLAHKTWPIPAIPGALNRELALPQYYESTAKLVTKNSLQRKSRVRQTQKSILN
jgi:hypothetical protein